MTGTEKPKSPRNLKHFLLPGCGGCRGTLLAAFYLYWKKSTKSQKKVWRCSAAHGTTCFLHKQKSHARALRSATLGEQQSPVKLIGAFSGVQHRVSRAEGILQQLWTILKAGVNFLRCLASVLVTARKQNGDQALLAGLGPQTLWCWCPQVVTGRPVPKCLSFHGRWHSKATTGLLLLLAQLGHWAPALAGALQKASGGDCNGLCQHITSLGKATVPPAPAVPSVADVAISLAHQSVHLLSSLVWKSRRLGILNNPEMWSGHRCADGCCKESIFFLNCQHRRWLDKIFYLHLKLFTHY